MRENLTTNRVNTSNSSSSSPLMYSPVNLKSILNNIIRKVARNPNVGTKKIQIRHGEMLSILLANIWQFEI